MSLRPEKLIRHFVVAIGAWASVCYGQDRWDMLTAKTTRLRGIRLYGVSVYSGYTSFTGPIDTLNQFVPNSVSIGSDTSYGAQWGLGWQHMGPKTTASFLYSGSYGGHRRYHNLNSLGYSLSTNVSRQFSSKWAVSLSAMADYRTLAQYLFQPTAQSVISQLPASASDLGAAFSVGSFSSNQAAASLSSSELDIASSPARELLLADRILSYQAQLSVSYAHSSRLRFHFSSASAGGQQSFDKTSTIVMPRTIGMSAGVSISYSLSPRTDVGVNVFEYRSKNQLQDAYSTNVNASLGRMMGEHWFLAINGGMSDIRMLNQGASSFPSRQAIGNASLGYRARAHTFLGSYSRSSVDAYGIAVGVNTHARGAWSWHRPGSAWIVFASSGQHQIRNTGFTSLTGWRTNVGITRMLSRQCSITSEYAYLYTTGSYLTFATQRTVHSIRLSLRWHPQGTPRLEHVPAMGGAGTVVQQQDP